MSRENLRTRCVGLAGSFLLNLRGGGYIVRGWQRLKELLRRLVTYSVHRAIRDHRFLQVSSRDVIS